MNILAQHLEALIFCSSVPIKIIELQTCLIELYNAHIEIDEIENTIKQLIDKYSDESFSFQIYQRGGGYEFLTKPTYQASISILLKQQSKKRLSASALETVALIAYKQPITKAQIEQIRGVSSDYAIQKLLERELVEIKGKADSPGRPILYGTSEKFMQYFGINHLRELPTLKDFTQNDNEIGQNPDN